MSLLLTLPIFLFISISAFLVTGTVATLITLIGIVKLLVPIKWVTHKATTLADGCMWIWATYLAFVLNQINQVKWDIKGIENLDKKYWYLLISNHQSWADVVVLCALFRNTLPMNKYFLKQELIWVPFVGLACWALDMPFMKRYSRSYLLKNPHLRGADIETTRRSCEKFQLRPTTVVNFVEGSRFTEEKRVKTNSVYHNLLPPKAAGIAYTLNALGDKFDKILNVTLVYPDNSSQAIVDILFGNMKQVIVRVETLPITEECRGDYFHDKTYKRQFQLWLNKIWQKKDLLIEQLKNQNQK